MIKHYNIIRLY